MFAMMTVIHEAIIFLPLMLLERKRIKSMNHTNTDMVYSLLNGWKKNKKLLIYLGINFAIAQILFYLAYQLTSVINASLAQKTTIKFGILFGIGALIIIISIVFIVKKNTIK